jgi:hypothetical protein
MAELCCLVGMCLGGTTVALFCVREPGRVAGTCNVRPIGSMGWDDAGPLVTAVVRCDPVVRGPDVAPMWPHGSRAWKVRPGSPLSRDPAPMAQARSVCDRPLLTVRDRQVPVLRARGGHGRRGRLWLRRGGDGHKLNRRVRLVQGNHLPCWQAAEAARQPASSVRERIRC